MGAMGALYPDGTALSISKKATRRQPEAVDERRAKGKPPGLGLRQSDPAATRPVELPRAERELSLPTCGSFLGVAGVRESLNWSDSGRALYWMPLQGRSKEINHENGHIQSHAG